MNFYRRPLPSSCISFSSEEGKTLFKEAMSSGHMENYFRLASQLRTQDEPAFCGLATIVMTLNALEIDPGRIWKGPWRWYHEDMLDCCIPLDIVKSKGITLEQFVCISKCNGLTVDVHRANETAELDEFRSIVSRITSRDDEILVASYSRRRLAQTGDGHFISIGGFHPGRQMLLLLETARFKYPPHWVSLETLWEAMRATDDETGLPRGYLVLTRDTDSSCLLLLGTSESLNKFSMMQEKGGSENAAFSEVMRNWAQWMAKQDGGYGNLVADEAMRCVVRDASNWLIKAALATSIEFPLTCHSHFSSGAAPDELEAALSDIIRQVVECQIGTEVGKVVDSLDESELLALSQHTFVLPKLHGCSLLLLQDNRMKLTFLLASWLMTMTPLRSPYRPGSVTATRTELLRRFSVEVVFSSQLNLQSQMELVQLSNKIDKMRNCQDRLYCCGDKAVASCF